MVVTTQATKYSVTLEKEMITPPGVEEEDLNNNNIKTKVITDITSTPTFNVDGEGLTTEVTVQCSYSSELIGSVRTYQKVTFTILVGEQVHWQMKGYVSSIKVSQDNDNWIIELSINGYNLFLEQTVEKYNETLKRSEHCKKIIEDICGLKADIDWTGLSDDSCTINVEASSTSSTNTSGSGLTEMSGTDCAGDNMHTNRISARSYDIDTCGGNTKIGNSNANYAQDTKNMTAKEAILNVFNRYKWVNYDDNRTCPQKMWKTTGTIYGNCADISRLIKCIGEVHGLKVGIRHCPHHYYNLIEIDGKVYKFDCCFKSGTTGSRFGSEVCNTLNRHGGPWS